MDTFGANTQVFQYKVTDAIRLLIRHCRDDPEREGLKETPDRVSRALLEMTEGYTQDPAVILSKQFSEPTDELIVVSGINFYSLCEHHLMPFHGTATVGYLPDKKVVGLSKIPRLVHCYSRRLQIQERLTQQITSALMDHLQPQGAGCIIQAHHTCMSMRGVKCGGTMTTSCLLGVIRDMAREEFLSFVHQHRGNP